MGFMSMTKFEFFIVNLFCVVSYKTSGNLAEEFNTSLLKALLVCIICLRRNVDILYIILHFCTHKNINFVNQWRNVKLHFSLKLKNVIF